MSKLIIVGNGFDLNNGLLTSYDDFREHLKLNDESFFNEINSFFDLNENLWSDIENNMFNSKNKIKRLVEEVRDSQWEEDYMDNDEPHKNDSDLQYAIDHEVRDKVPSSAKLNEKLINWISSAIKLSKQKMVYIDGYVVNFNYTNYVKGIETLNVHGTLLDKEVNFGHSATLRNNRKVTNFGNDELSSTEVYNWYGKNALKCRDEFLEFISVSGITEVVIKGLSVGDQDKHYIDLLDKGLKITYYFHDKNDKQHIFDVLNSMGFTDINPVKW